jgi:hypothetical protein
MVNAFSPLLVGFHRRWGIKPRPETNNRIIDLLCRECNRKYMQRGTGTCSHYLPLIAPFFEESKKRQKATKNDKKWQGQFKSYS